MGSNQADQIDKQELQHSKLTEETLISHFERNYPICFMQD